MGAKSKYKISLSGEQISFLTAVSTTGKSSARSMLRARVLLKSNEGWGATQIEEALDISRPAINRIQQRFLTLGLDKALLDDPRPGPKPKLTDEQAAMIIATACSEPPAGHDHWTLRLLAEKAVELQFVERYSHEAVRRLLKKTR
jgi:transposase